MVGTVGNKGLNAHRYETGTSVPVSFFGAPGRAHLLGGGSPLLARQGEELAERQGNSGRTQGEFSGSAGKTQGARRGTAGQTQGP